MPATRRIRTGAKFSEPAAREIALLLEMASDLERIVEASKNRAPTAHLYDLVDEIARALDLDNSVLRRVFNALENFRALSEGHPSYEEAVDRIKNGVSEQLAEKVEEQRTRLVNIAKLFTDDNPVSMSFKSQRLSFRHERLFHSVEIITDARPIFSTSADNVVEFVITHEMALEYLTGDNIETVFVALDNSDLIKLRKACDRAILKSRTLKTTLDGFNAEILHDEAAD